MSLDALGPAGSGQVLLDGRPLQTASAVRGIGSYVRGLLEGCADLGVAQLMKVVLSRAAKPPEVDALSLDVARLRVPMLHPTLQPSADLLLLHRALANENARLFHGVEWGQPLMARIPVVMTVHDLIPFVFPRHYPWVRRARLLPLQALRRATHVVAVSEATARDVERIAHVDPRRITVIHEGIAPDFQPAPAAAVSAFRARTGLGERRYLLAVGTFDPRKRIRLLADVIRRVRASLDVDLVIAGDQASFAARVRAALDAAGVAERSHVLGHVTQSELVTLYSGAACLVFTSAYEGFGLPPLEAMACGARVAMFHNSSLPEVAGPAAVTVPDGDAQAMADAVCELLEETGDGLPRVTAGRDWAAQFTWRRSAERTLAVYSSTLQRD
jgi:glycosyltransferase involved in cell wall biosynthesis